MFNIDNQENNILAVGYENKAIGTKEKWNQLNLIDIQSLFGNNHRLPLSHMAKSYIWLEETNKRINEFSIGYIMSPNLNMNKVFRDQVKVCIKTTFSASTMTKISKMLLKPNTRVLALVIFFENRKNSKKMFRVLSIVIYTILINYVCIDYLGSEKSKLSYLRLGVAGSYKRFGKNMTTYWDSKFHICY